MSKIEIRRYRDVTPASLTHVYALFDVDCGRFLVDQCIESILDSAWPDNARIHNAAFDLEALFDELHLSPLIPSMYRHEDEDLLHCEGCTDVCDTCKRMVAFINEKGYPIRVFAWIVNDSIIILGGGNVKHNVNVKGQGYKWQKNKLLKKFGYQVKSVIRRVYDLKGWDVSNNQAYNNLSLDGDDHFTNREFDV